MLKRNYSLYVGARCNQTLNLKVKIKLFNTALNDFDAKNLFVS